MSTTQCIAHVISWSPTPSETGYPQAGIPLFLVFDNIEHTQKAVELSKVSPRTASSALTGIRREPGTSKLIGEALDIDNIKLFKEINSSLENVFIVVTSNYINEPHNFTVWADEESATQEYQQAKDAVRNSNMSVNSSLTVELIRQTISSCKPGEVLSRWIATF